ncbi:SDR family NAD(P)-dependent oxidoreductase [Leptolyngbya ohadii]|uniref:SDR family NAD(P)-dependent oxidoreductase n=1 Tax=Leptolyngbya ohadii TaxID=1962290 RepID=UPI000B59EE90|nr:SDR family oxidoreductase [Leptolyngbya ohadii]
MQTFSSKTVLITGASGGIGRATAIAFAKAGTTVALHYGQRSEKVEQVRQELSGEGHILVQADLNDPIAIEKMVNETIAQLGRIDILVNNAGVYQLHPLDQVSYEEWQQAWQETIGVNLMGAANIAYCVARHMIDRRQGRIVNVSSRGAFRGEPIANAYGASKAGLNALSQSLAQHLAPYNIGVTAVAPGFVETEMARSVLDSPDGNAIRQQSPFGRVATPEEVAHTILFLAAEESLFLSGTIVDVNGASYLRS